MSSGLINLRIDPYADRKPNGNAGFQKGYLDPRVVVFDNGDTAASYMPSGPFRGVVIPHALPGGGSRAYNPHNPPNRLMTIDPHIAGQSVQIDLNDINPGQVAAAAQVGREYAEQHHDEVDGIESIRLAGAAAFHLLASDIAERNRIQHQQLKTAKKNPAPQPQQPVLEAADPQEWQPSKPAQPASFGGSRSIVQPPSNPQVVPLSQSSEPPDMSRMFNGPASATIPQPSQAPPPRVIRTAEEAVTSPQCRVRFQIPGFGDHDAFYHSVAIVPAAGSSHGKIVLIYDNRFRGPRYFPNKVELPFAAWVEGKDEIFQVVSPDLIYEVDEKTHCVLLVSQTAQYNQGDERS